MSSAARTPASTSGQTFGRRWMFRIISSLLIGLACLGMLAMLIRWFGLVYADEFSPDLFERRSFVYYELPFVHLQITPIFYIDQTGDLEAYITTNKYVVRQPNNPRWDCIQARRANVTVTEGAAKILATYFEKETLKDEGPLMQWTKDHPAAAKVLWPAVAAVARDGRYVFVPDVIELARSSSDANKFSTELNRLLAEKYSVWGALEEQVADYAEAQTAYQKALSFDPANAAAKDGLARLKAVL